MTDKKPPQNRLARTWAGGVTHIVRTTEYIGLCGRRNLQRVTKHHTTTICRRCQVSFNKEE